MVLKPRLRLIGATALCYALKMLQRVFHYCAKEYKMDINGKVPLAPQLTHWHHNHQKIGSSALEHENIFFSLHVGNLVSL